MSTPSILASKSNGRKRKRIDGHFVKNNGSPAFSEEDARRLIDAAVSGGKITKCPPRWAQGAVNQDPT